jgi:hypothetical protein
MRAIGTLSISLGVGAALGPALAGVIVDHAGPSAIFWVGLPGALPALIAGRLIRDSGRRGPAGIDWLGAALLAGALAALLILMTQGRQLGWTSLAALALAAIAAGLFPTWLAIEARQAAPLVDVRLLRRPTIALTNGAALCIGCGIFIAYVPLAPIAEAPAVHRLRTRAVGQRGRRASDPPWRDPDPRRAVGGQPLQPDRHAGDIAHRCGDQHDHDGRDRGRPRQRGGAARGRRDPRRRPGLRADGDGELDRRLGRE